MVVCVCCNVTEDELCDCKKKHMSVDDVIKELEVTSCCGCCREDVERLFLDNNKTIK